MENIKEIYNLIDKKFAEYEDLMEEFAATDAEGSLSKLINIKEQLLSIENTKDPFIDTIREERIQAELSKLSEEAEEREEEIKDKWYGYAVDEMLGKMTDYELEAYLKYADELKERFIEKVSGMYEYDAEQNIFIKNEEELEF